MSMSRPVLLVAASLCLSVLAGCQEKEEAAGAPPAPPPSPVGVVEARSEAIPVVSELPGRISPTQIAEVRPRVGGIILERVFEQGTDVKEGDPLFRIDPATFEVAVQAAQAGVARAEAVLLQASQDAERTRTLVSRNTVGTANLDSAVALQRQAEADLASSRANLRSAEINLDYATVRAPISGRIGRAIVTEGALVSATGTEALATIQQLDPVYADIQQPVAELLRLRAALKNGTLTQLEPDVAQARLMLDDGTEYPYPGRLLFSEATVEETSGQVTLRAEFPNPDDTLLPGLYVRVALDQGIDSGAIAVPNQAIQRDTAGQSLLYLVNANSTVEVRQVSVGRVVGNRTIVTKGLAAGDKVIADGFQKIGPGAPVTTTPWTPTGEAAKELGAEDTQGVGAGTDTPEPAASDDAAPEADAPQVDAGASATPPEAAEAKTGGSASAAQ